MPERVGRPRASSRETIAEAACELFLEQGYDATTVADITRRAGVARSSFFSYFRAKSDVVWSAFDDRLEAAVTILAAGADVRRALTDIGVGLAPDALSLAIVQADAMGLADELDRERAVRQSRLARALAARLRADGGDPLAAEVRAATLAGAVLAAVWAWATGGPGGPPLDATLRRALDLAAA